MHDFDKFLYGYKIAILNNVPFAPGYKNNLALNGYTPEDFSNNAKREISHLCDRFFCDSRVSPRLERVEAVDMASMGDCFYQMLDLRQDRAFIDSFLARRYGFNADDDRDIKRAVWELVPFIYVVDGGKITARRTGFWPQMGMSSSVTSDALKTMGGQSLPKVDGPSEPVIPYPWANLRVGVDKAKGPDKTFIVKARTPLKSPGNFSDLVEKGTVAVDIETYPVKLPIRHADYASMELRMLALMDKGCTCFQCAPCDFCMSLTEEEANVFASKGTAGLKAYWDSLTDDRIPEVELNAITKPVEAKPRDMKLKYAPATYYEAKKPTDTDRNGKKIKLSPLPSKSLADAERDRFNLTADIMLGALSRFHLPTLEGLMADKVDVSQGFAMAERIAYLEGWQVCWTKSLNRNSDAHDARIVEKTGNAIVSLPEVISGRIDPIHRRLVCAALAYMAFLRLGGTAVQIDRMIKDITGA